MRRSQVYTGSTILENELLKIGLGLGARPSDLISLLIEQGIPLLDFHFNIRRVTLLI